jgi:hypothetical protein
MSHDSDPHEKKLSFLSRYLDDELKSVGNIPDFDDFSQLSTLGDYHVGGDLDYAIRRGKSPRMLNPRMENTFGKISRFNDMNSPGSSRLFHHRAIDQLLAHPAKLSHHALGQFPYDDDDDSAPNKNILWNKHRHRFLDSPNYSRPNLYNNEFDVPLNYRTILDQVFFVPRYHAKEPLPRDDSSLVQKLREKVSQADSLLLKQSDNNNSPRKELHNLIFPIISLYGHALKRCRYPLIPRTDIDFLLQDMPSFLRALRANAEPEPMRQALDRVNSFLETHEVELLTLVTRNEDTLRGSIPDFKPFL